MKINSCFIIYLIGILLPVLSIGQVKTPLTRAQIDSLVNPNPLVNGDSYLKIDTKVIDMGTLNDNDSPSNYTFTVKNLSRRDVNITQIRTTCGCTVARFDTGTIKSGEEQNITLTYSPRNEKGEVEVKSYIYTNISSKQPTTIVELKGYVKSSDKWRHLPFRMGALRIKNKRISFETITRSMNPTMAIVCANSGSIPLKLSCSDLPPYATFKCKPEILEPNCEGELLITINGALIPQNETSSQFTFKIEGVEAQPIERIIKVTIEK